MTYFLKTRPNDRARSEITGWRIVQTVLDVPALHGWRDTGDHTVISYDDVFANGRCQHLLGDCIALADHHLASDDTVAVLVDGICDDILATAARTGHRSRLDATVPALYATRLRPGDRVETWYAPTRHLYLRGQRITVADLANHDIEINDSHYRIDLATIIDETRHSLRPSSRWITALTQGDPTEPNIAFPKTWLDFEYAGRNTIAGDIANLIWYLLAMGGWLVPRYQPATYQRTLRHPLPPVVTPFASRLDLSPSYRHIELRTCWPVGAGRATAIEHLTTAIEDRFTPLLADGDRSVMGALRPFLVCRLLGVLPLHRLWGDDTALCLAKLAQIQDPQVELRDLFADLTVQERTR